MDEQEFMERMKRANSKVKDGMVAKVIDMLPEDRELASIKLTPLSKTSCLKK